MVARFLACIARTSPERLALNGHHLRGLHIQDRMWTNANLKRLLPHLPHLQWLTVGESTKINCTSIQHLPTHCHRLTSLDLCNVELSVASAVALGRYCRHLETFNYAHCNSLLPDHLAPLAACPLAHVRLTSENKLSAKAMVILRTWHRLASLTIHQLHSTMNALLLAPPSPRATTTPLVVWTCLMNLSLHPCEDIDDDTLVRFLRSHRGLVQLHLQLTYELTDTSLDAIASSLGNLTHLTWTGNDNVSSNSVRRLLRQCRDLQSADFSDCDQLMPDLLRSIGGDSLELNQRNIDVIRQDSMA